MDRDRLGRAVLDAVLVSFLLGAILSPPDPFTQILYTVATFALSLPLAYRFGPQIHRYGRKRHALFVAGVVLSQVVWTVLPAGVSGPFVAPLHAVVIAGGATLGAWLAYFGGLDRLRGRSEDPA